MTTRHTHDWEHTADTIALAASVVLAVGGLHAWASGRGGLSVLLWWAAAYVWVLWFLAWLMATLLSRK